MNSSILTNHIHSYWISQKPVPSGVHLAVGIFIVITGFIAICGNTLVVWTCMRYRDLRTSSNVFILNLAVGDLLMCVIDFPLLAVASFLNRWPFGMAVCQIYAFFTAVAGMVTINSLAVIAADRYWAVVKRPNPRQQLPKCLTGIAITFIWVYSTTWALCPILGWGAYVLDGIGTTCTFDYLTRTWSNRSFVLGMIAGNFCLPFSIMIFSYSRIWMSVREIKRGLERESSHVAIGRRRFHSSSLVSLSSAQQCNRSFRNLSCKCDISQGLSILYEGLAGVNEAVYGNGNRGVRMTNKITCNKSFKIHKTELQCQGLLQKGRRETIPDKEDNKLRSIPRSLSHMDFTTQFGNSSFRSKHNFIILNSLIYKFRSNPYFDVASSNFSKLNVSVNDVTEYVYSQTGLPQTYQTRSRNYDFCSSHNCVTTRKVKNYSFRTLRHCWFFSALANKIRQAHRTFANLRTSGTQRHYRLHCEHRTIKIIFFLMVAFTLSWCPYTTVSLIGLFGGQTRISYLTSIIPSLIAKTSMVFNPVLYSISHPKVRKRMASSLCC